MNETKPQWNPRVSRHKIRQLYQRDALGIQDEALVDEVGMTLLMRVESCLMVSDAQRGKVHCPVCGTVVERDLHPRHQKTAIVACTNCDWQLPWEDYRSTFHNKHLGCAGMLVPCQEFFRKYTEAKNYPEKMVLIDTLIHRFHWEMEGHPAQPGAATIIGGKMSDIADFLDDLTYGHESTPGLAERKEAWREIAKDKFYGPSKNRTHTDPNN